MSRKLSQSLKDRANQPGPDGLMPLQSDHFDLTSLPTDCVAIPLSNGGFTLVDEEDECRVDDRDWFKSYHADSRTWYAKTVIKTEHGRHQISMHRFLFGLDRGDRVVVDHKNHDGLDNRRSANLRLATSIQNSANSRKLKKAASKYRGVSWHSREEKWQAQITWFRGGIRKTFLFGRFASEVEAAYAYQVAAPLLKDPDFLDLEEIPADELPCIERLDEIRRNTIAKVKLNIAGYKGGVNKTSLYTGVSYSKRDMNWHVSLRMENGRSARLGAYRTDKEAAYAHNCAIEILKLTGRHTNPVGPEDLDDPGDADRIRTFVTTRLEAWNDGHKGRFGRSSQFAGISLSKKTSKWLVSVWDNSKQTYVGCFDEEVVAALAYNIAVELLGIPHLTPNVIPGEDMPPPETVGRMRLDIKDRLEKRHGKKPRRNRRHLTLEDLEEQHSRLGTWAAVARANEMTRANLGTLVAKLKSRTDG